jgi:subtilisin family serine protease
MQMTSIIKGNKHRCLWLYGSDKPPSPVPHFPVKYYLSAKKPAPTASNVLKSKYKNGKGVRIAILDTGIHAEHPDFEGRKIRAVSFVGKSTNDLDGHGTHCAGIAAGHVSHSHGFRYGVAPQAQLFVAKVLKTMVRARITSFSQASSGH